MANTFPEENPSDDDLARILGATTARNRYGEHLVFRSWHQQPEQQTFTADALQLLDPDLPRRAASLKNWLFLDTETTGLSAANGSYAFLIGLAWWDAGGLQVEQLFMRDPTEEHSVLLALKERMSGRDILVTFNGKTFDWPLLETRLRMTRSIILPAPRAHLDMLQPARQLWRPRLGSVKLTELEHHILHDQRDEDVPSALVPRFYCDFLSGGSSAPVFRILRHNRMDLQALAALVLHALALLSCETSPGEHPLDILARARFLQRRGSVTRAQLLFREALERGLPATENRAACLHLARLAKTEGDFALACSLWEELRTGADNSVEKLHACEQLAIHHERRERKPERAAEITEVALASLRDAHVSATISAIQTARWDSRLESRLQRLRSSQVRRKNNVSRARAKPEASPGAKHLSHLQFSSRPLSDGWN